MEYLDVVDEEDNPISRVTRDEIEAVLKNEKGIHPQLLPCLQVLWKHETKTQRL